MSPEFVAQLEVGIAQPSSTLVIEAVEPRFDGAHEGRHAGPGQATRSARHASGTDIATDQRGQRDPNNLTQSREPG